jgi:hypothetical protein
VDASVPGLRALFLTLVLAPSPVLGQDSWSLRRVATIGSSDGPGAMTTAGGALLIEDGPVIVSQPRDPGVLLFTVQGTFLKRVGRPGQGPGDFRQPYWLQYVDGHIAVADPGLRRVSVMTRDGEVRAVVQVPPELRIGGHALTVLGLMENGSVLVSSGDHLADYSTAYTPGHLSAIDPATLEVVQWDTVRLAGRIGMLRNPEQPDGSTSFIYPHATSDLVVLSPTGNGAALVRRHDIAGGRAEVVRYGARGDTLFRALLVSPRVQIPDDEFNETRASLIRGTLRAGLFNNRTAATREIEKVIANTRIYPPALDAALGVDGELWIRQPVPDHAGGAWIVLETDGSVISHRIRHPGGRLLFASKEFVLFADEDQDGVPKVEVYAVSAGG